MRLELAAAATKGVEEKKRDCSRVWRRFGFSAVEQRQWAREMRETQLLWHCSERGKRNAL